MPGQGSSFWFVVPLGKCDYSVVSAKPEAALPDGEAGERLRQEFSGARVLLAEDEPVSREVGCGLLQQVGLQVDVAEDGQQALALARQNRYALILMDMQMPNLNGTEATRAILADSLNRQTPILALTANAYDEDRQACFAAGMRAHIAKPVAPAKLYEILLKWLVRNGDSTGP